MSKIVVPMVRRTQNPSCAYAKSGKFLRRKATMSFDRRSKIVAPALPDRGLPLHLWFQHLIYDWQQN